MKKAAVVLVILSVALFGVFAAANKALKAETGGESDMLRKLDDILNNQKTILQGIADLKQELYVVKIRVTQQQ